MLHVAKSLMSLGDEDDGALLKTETGVISSKDLDNRSAESRTEGAGAGGICEHPSSTTAAPAARNDATLLFWQGSKRASPVTTSQVAGPDAEELKGLADRYLAKCFDLESPPQVKELAGELHMSRSDLSKVFVRVVGEHPSSYLRRGQIEYAKQLLAETDLPLNKIAYKCGFGTRTTFFRAFKRLVGMTPREYRRAAR